jgi:type VI secretion system protein ImpM
VPEFVRAPARATIFADAAIGFLGKIPARGDFVRVGLPREFADAWDAWMERMLAASRSALGEDWLSAWLEGPVWRFALSAGTCGPDAVLGLWMPSVDRVGRYFPLTVAAVAADAEAAQMIREGGGFLAAAEAAGRDAVERDCPPERLGARILAASAETPADAGIDPDLCPRTGALWWTAGSPRVPPCSLSGPGLPDAPEFAPMLDAGGAAAP